MGDFAAGLTRHDPAEGRLLQLGQKGDQDFGDVVTTGRLARDSVADCVGARREDVGHDGDGDLLDGVTTSKNLHPQGFDGSECVISSEWVV